MVMVYKIYDDPRSQTLGSCTTDDCVTTCCARERSSPGVLVGIVNREMLHTWKSGCVGVWVDFHSETWLHDWTRNRGDWRR